MPKNKVTGSHDELIGTQIPAKNSVTRLSDLKPQPGSGDKTKPGSSTEKKNGK